MALMKLRGELPKDAVYLSEEEALQHQWNLVWDWTPKLEIFPLRFGHVVAGVLSSLSGFYLNNHYRRKLKLKSYGRLSSYIPIVVFPCFLTSLAHTQLVTNDILLQKTKCSVCLEMRAVAIQAFIGFIYPIVLAPVAGFMNATNYLTYDIPSLTKSPKQVLGLYWKLTKPITTKLSIILALQTLAASLITYQEAKTLYKVQSELIKREKESVILMK